MNLRRRASIWFYCICGGWCFTVVFNINCTINADLYFNKLKLYKISDKRVFIMSINYRDFIDGCFYNTRFSVILCII